MLTCSGRMSFTSAKLWSQTARRVELVKPNLLKDETKPELFASADT